MRFNQKIHIDLLAFFRTGKFDCLEPGQTKEWILHNFPDPDGFETVGALANADIWRYGNIELHFSGQELWLIFSDYIDSLNGGDSLSLNKWILDTPQERSLENIIRAFLRLRMDFSISHRQDLGHVELILQESQVKLLFNGEPEAEVNTWQLDAFSRQ
jgi:hypothetical protein